MKARSLARWRTALRPLLRAHAMAVVALTALFFYLSSLSGPDDGANIGAGMVLLPLGALGLPWSLLTIVERLILDFIVIPPGQPLPGWAIALDLFCLIAPAYVNIAIHAWGNATGRWGTHPPTVSSAGGEGGRRSRLVPVLAFSAAVLLVIYVVERLVA